MWHFVLLTGASILEEPVVSQSLIWTQHIPLKWQCSYKTAWCHPRRQLSVYSLFQSTSHLIKFKTLQHAADRLYVVNWPVLELFENTRKYRIANKECYESINNWNKHLRRDSKVHCSAWTHIWSKKKLLWVYKRNYKMKCNCTINRKN